MEGKRHHEYRVTYDRSHNHAFFVERDLLEQQSGEGGRHGYSELRRRRDGRVSKLRTMNLGMGQSAQIPVSDGRRSAPSKWRRWSAKK